MKAHLKTMNWGAFLITGVLACYALASVTDNQWFKLCAVPIGLFVEYQAQEIWGLSETRKNAKLKYGWLRGVYVWYVVVFGLMAGIGFVLTEINNQGDIVKQVTANKADIQKQIDRINRDIDGLIAQREREGATGTGERYKFLQSKIDAAKGELKEWTDKQKGVSKIQSRDMYVNLEQEIGIPKVWLVGFTIGSALFIVYLGLMLRPMKVDIEISPKPIPEAGEVIPKYPDEIKGENRSNILSIVEHTEGYPNSDHKRLFQEISEFKYFIEEWFGEEEGPHDLPSVEKINISDSKRRKFTDYLRDIGAIRKVQGLPCRALWPKDKIIRHIENHYEVA